MPNIPIGSQKGDSPKTPTLRQFWKQKEGKIPNTSYIKIVFPPRKVPNYSLVTEAGYRVSVLEDNPLHNIIRDGLPTWIEDGTVLAVQVDDGEKGHWSLVSLSNETGSWEEKDWGYKVEITTTTKTRRK